jgi:uncharacterized membrane protein
VGLILGVLAAAGAYVWFVRAVQPEIGTGDLESTWAEDGVRGLFTGRGLMALAMAATALVLLVFAFRPGRRDLPVTFFSREEKRALLDAIAAAEDRTSGEIRIHLARCTTGDVFEAAKAAFNALGMKATRARNGVLIYLSVDDHRFAIVGDEGIDRVVPEGFWDEIKDGMQERFSNQRFAEGIAEAVAQIGDQLHAFFPFDSGDQNELSDEISTEPG